MERTLAILADKVGVGVNIAPAYLGLLLDPFDVTNYHYTSIWSVADTITPFSLSLSDTTAGDGV